MKNSRVFPSTFTYTQGEDITLLEQEPLAEWRTLSMHLQQHQTKSAAIMTPLFWQISGLFYHTCQKLSVPAAVLPERNIPLACELIRQAEISYIVTTPESALTLNNSLRTDSAIITQWHLIVPENFSAVVSLPSEKVIFEKYRAPGSPIV